ncbi:protein kinase domain-containing protein [Nitrospirillum sp. BR 11828]|uniref:protein kinase domain-containing protein n=1 Tax=Nitrospirillum sp. BR 11828 TaxID=3104325 RepID=UPI002ACA3C9D|nr:protein phosphatase 2C domain-containing protein [Nitrospirillum sp. BR 11828]MDZ5649568.1 protein phosphatase 2C domain-containing protein [Nitrospirillum sp. BR 11828]
MGAGQIELRAGWCSETGRRPRNEDYVGVCLGTATQRARQGTVAAIADGVSGAPGGRVAAELAVRAFIDFYLGERQTLGVRRAAAHAAEAINRWIHAQGRVDPERTGMATTLTAVILRDRRAHILHVGDSRLYRLRDGRLSLLTEDHVHSGPDQRHILRRAIGLEDALRADYTTEPLREGDRLVLLTDGVHGVLSSRDLARLAAAEPTPEAASQQLVAAALSAGSHDNATALVIDVVALPPADRDELAEMTADLPILPLPKPGDIVDGYRIGRPLSDGRYSALFLTEPAGKEAPLVLKFPKPAVAADAVYRLAFVREGWVAARVRSPWLGEVVEVPPGRQTRLYTVMPYYPGQTLAQRLLAPPRVGVAEGVPLAVKLAKAVAALHRAGIIHRDIKPDNVIIDGAGGLRLIDLGVVRLPGMEDFPAEQIPGTPSYMAPELLAGEPGDERTDLYALGVTVYHLFTGAYPYGEIEPFQRPRFGVPVPVQQRRPDLPTWLDLSVMKAVAANPADRPGDVLEFALELEAGAAHPTPRPTRRRSLYDRDPVRFWKLTALALLVLLILSLVRD